jgi:hypothetical protein
MGISTYSEEGNRYVEIGLEERRRANDHRGGIRFESLSFFLLKATLSD